MPYSNFDYDLELFDGGDQVRAAGPFMTEDDMATIVVYAVVTQAPQVKGAKPATCRGSVEVTLPKKAGKARWSFTAEIQKNTPAFREGWANGTAYAVITRTSGDIETYTWSQWVQLYFEKKKTTTGKKK
jgi:hypothetical protein